VLLDAAPPSGDAGECSWLFAGNPGRIRSVLAITFGGGSDNPTVGDRTRITPENQQERLENSIN
jgi:hypothetical protein